jgi:iron(III) transport system ATP-binding protein
MVFQTYAIWPHMNVFDNVAYPLQTRKESKEDITRKVKKTLRFVQLEGFENRPATKLTELKITAVYVTHDRVEALALSDSIAVMKDGHIMEIGTPKKIYFNSDHRFVADFIGRANLIEGKVRVVEDSYAIIDSSIGAITCPRSPDTSPGNTVSVCIRPEFIKVMEKDTRESRNIFRGRVDSLVFVGEVYEGEIIIADTHLFIRIEPTLTIRAGEEITLFLDPDHCFVLSK